MFRCNPIVTLVLSAIGAVLIGGCSRSTTVTVENTTSQPLRGFVQVPHVVEIGYPAKSSRHHLGLKAGEAESFRHRNEDEVLVDNWSEFAYLAIATQRDRWLLAKTSAGSTSHIRFRITAGEAGDVVIECLSDEHLDSQILSTEELDEFMGSWAKPHG